MTLQELISSIDDKNGVKELHQFILDGGDINQSLPNSGWSLMHVACEHENYQLIQAIHKANPSLLNCRAACNYPPLFQALDIDVDGAIQQNEAFTFKTTKLLLELGADPNIKDLRNNRTLREMAKGRGDIVLQALNQLIKKYSK